LGVRTSNPFIKKKVLMVFCAASQAPGQPEPAPQRPYTNTPVETQTWETQESSSENESATSCKPGQLTLQG